MSRFMVLSTLGRISSLLFFVFAGEPFLAGTGKKVLFYSLLLVALVLLAF